MFKYYSKNIKNFSAVCHNDYGRKVIKTNVDLITDDNVCQELARAIPIHQQNAIEIDYLDRYYRGDKPILYRKKVNRPEVNNKIVKNLSFMLVETKASEMVGEPIQYVLKGTEQGKAKQVIELNSLMETMNKPFYDGELCRWRSICGTGYRFVDKKKHKRLLDETNFRISNEDPRYTFVAYYSVDDYPAFSCQIREDENNETVYFVYTESKFYKIKNDEIVYSTPNGNGAIPIVEYPNNSRRLSDIEMTIFIEDEINKTASDRSNGIEQFVSSWIKFVNCEIDSEKFKKMRQEGAIAVKSNNGSDNKADVDLMTSELNQSETQVAVNDLYEQFLVIQGLANRQGNTGGDTGNAVSLRNGWTSMEKRSQVVEPAFIVSENMFLRLVLNRLKINEQLDISPDEIEIKISRTKTDNIYTKVESLKMLLDSGVDSARALKTVDIWNDPERVAEESRKRMEILYPTEIEEQTVQQNQPQQVKSQPQNGGADNEPDDKN